MADQYRIPLELIWWGDHTVGRLIAPGRMWTTRDGVLMREGIYWIMEETLRSFDIDIQKVGVTEKGVPGGKFLKRSYPASAFWKTVPFNNFGVIDHITFIDVGFDGSKNTEFVKRMDGLLEDITLLQKLLENKRINVATLLEDNEILQKQVSEYLKVISEMKQSLSKRGESVGEELEEVKEEKSKEKS